MGGHGGLNILPQKSWNVYGFKCRARVEKDEEELAKELEREKEEQLSRDGEIRHAKLLERAAERRIQQLPLGVGAGKPCLLSGGEKEAVTAKGAAAHDDHTAGVEDAAAGKAPHTISLEHQDFFESVLAASSSRPSKEMKAGERGRGFRENGGCEQGGRTGKGFEESREKKRKRKEVDFVKEEEDERYRLGYGLAGAGVSQPWYVSKRSAVDRMEEEESAEGKRKVKKTRGEQGGGGMGSLRSTEIAIASGVEQQNDGSKKKRKSLVELRAERLKREKEERERLRHLNNSFTTQGSGRVSNGGQGGRGRQRYHSSFGNAR